MSKPKSATPHWINNLRSLMDAGGFNPRSLSLKAGLNQTAVRDMLEGRTRFPRYDTVAALAEALGTTPALLMGATVGEQALKNTQVFDGDVELLTEIITRLQEVVEENRRQISPRDFAAMVTTIYRQLQDSKPRKQALSALRPKIHSLLEYETLRRRPAAKNRG